METMEKIKYENKSDFRLSARSVLEKISNTYVRDKKLSKELIDIISAMNVRSVLLYLPLPIEANINDVIRLCRKKIEVYVPFMEGFSFKMVKLRLPLEKKRFGIKEPKNSLVRKPKIDLAVVPVIGVDGALKRIGFGMGMYDRFFASISPKPTLLFVQRHACMTRTLLCEAHDIQADIYLTPHHIIIKRGYNDFRITSGRCCPSRRRCRVFHRQKDGSGQL